MRKSLCVATISVAVLALSACGGSEPDLEEDLPLESVYGSPCRPYNSIDSCAVSVTAAVTTAERNYDHTGFHTPEETAGLEEIKVANAEWEEECAYGAEGMVGELDPACVGILDRISNSYLAVVGPSVD